MEGLKKAGQLQKWGKAADDLTRRNVFMGELRMVGPCGACTFCQLFSRGGIPQPQGWLSAQLLNLGMV